MKKWILGIIILIISCISTKAQTIVPCPTTNSAQPTTWGQYTDFFSEPTDGTNPATNPGAIRPNFCVDNHGVITFLTLNLAGGTVVTQSGTFINNRVIKATSNTTIGNSSGFDDGINPTQWPNGISFENNGGFDTYSVAAGGVTAGLAVCRSGANQVTTCAAGAKFGFIGIAQATVLSGGTVHVCLLAHCIGTEDGTVTSGDWVVLSPTIAGELHDSGLPYGGPCPDSQQSFLATLGNSGSATPINVDILTPDTGICNANNNGSGGNIRNAPQFSIAYYSAPGTTNTISGLGPNTSNIPQVLQQVNGTIASFGVLGVPVDDITTTSYTLVCSDTGRMKKFDSASAVALTFPTANTCSSPSQPNFITLINPNGAGTITITPTSGTIGKSGGTQGATLVLTQGQPALIYTDSVSTGCTVTACYDALVIGSGSGTVTQNTFPVPELLINGTNNVTGSNFTWTKATQQPNQVWVSPQVGTLPNYVQATPPQVCLGSGAQTTCVATFPANVNGGDAIIAVVSTGNTTTFTGGGVADSQSNSYTIVQTWNSSIPNIFVVCNATAGKTTITFTGTGGGAPEINFTAFEISGNSNPCIDKAGNSTSSLSVTTSGTVSQPNEFVFATIHDADTTLAPVIFTPPTGYTQIQQYNCNIGGCSSAHEDMTFVANNSNSGLAGTQTATFTVTGTTTNISASIVTLKLTSTGGIPTFNQLLWATLPVNTTTPTSGDCLNVTGNPNIGTAYQITDAGIPCTGEIGSSTVPAWSIVGFSGSALTLSSTTFLPFSGGGVSSTTETNVDQNSPQASIVSNLFVQVSSAPGTGNSFTFTARKAATSQTLTCTISNSATSCSDTTHSFSTTQGDLLDWQIVPSGTIVVTPNVIISAQWAVNTVQVQSVVTGSRSIGTTFQNTGQKPLYVSVSAFSNTTGNFIALTDSSSPPTTQVCNTGLNSNFTGTLFFIVLPGNFYKLTFGGTVTLSSWIEWQ